MYGKSETLSTFGVVSLEKNYDFILESAEKKINP